MNDSIVTNNRAFQQRNTASRSKLVSLMLMSEELDEIGTPSENSDSEQTVSCPENDTVLYRPPVPKMDRFASLAPVHTARTFIRTFTKSNNVKPGSQTYSYNASNGSNVDPHIGSW